MVALLSASVELIAHSVTSVIAALRSCCAAIIREDRPDALNAGFTTTSPAPLSSDL